MKRTFLHLIVLPENHSSDEIRTDSLVTKDDKFSTITNININKKPFGYTIVYTDQSLTKLRLDVLMKNIQNLMKDQLPDYRIEFTIDYFYKINDGTTALNTLVLEGILHIDMNANQNSTSLDPLIYHRSPSVSSIINILKESEDQDEPTEETDKQDQYTMVDQVGYMHKENESAQNINAFIRDLYGIDLDDDDHKKKKKKKKVQAVASSRVLRAAGNPKKLYKRHGVIVCKNKKAIKKDADIIKEFLEDFIPGNAGWKKDLRKELKKRWMRVFVITKSQLKHLEKDYQKSRNNNATAKRNKQIVSMTNRVLNVPIDKWSDPSL